MSNNYIIRSPLILTDAETTIWKAFQEYMTLMSPYQDQDFILLKLNLVPISKHWVVIYSIGTIWIGRRIFYFPKKKEWRTW